MEAGKNGVTTNTPKNITFGAGTIHRGLKYDPLTSKWNKAESVIGATSGGSKISIVPEIFEIPIDGANVPVKETKVKTGEAAEMEVNFVELTKDIIKWATIATDGTSEDATYDLIVSKGSIEEGDYLENIAFIGKTLDGRDIMVIFENALCTSGYESENKAKENAVGTYTFACHAGLDADTLDILPWKIYYPKPTI